MKKVIVTIVALTAIATAGNICTTAPDGTIICTDGTIVFPK